MGDAASIDAIERKLAEREFHNARFADNADVRDSLEKWYAAIESGARLHTELVRRAAVGASVLEYGCADGSLSLGDGVLVSAASRYCGIDISDRAIERACVRAAAAGFKHCSFEVMDAEALTFEDASFDVVFGRGIVHHLDLERCFSEVRRVLKPGGQAFFYEPLGHNLALNWYRRRTPHLRTADEHPLRMADLELAAKHFEHMQTKFVGLTTLLAVPLRAWCGDRPMRMFQRIDELLLRYPRLQPQAWHVLLILGT